MNKKNKIFSLFFMISLIFSLGLTNCSDDDKKTSKSNEEDSASGESLTSNMPTKLTVKVPSSLKSPVEGSLSKELKSIDLRENISSSDGYMQIQMLTGNMQMNSTMAAINLLLISQVEEKVKADAGNCVDGLSVKITDAFKNSLKTLLSDIGIPASEIDQMLSDLKSTMPAPPMIYNANKYGYENEILFYTVDKEEPTCSDASAENMERILWTGKTKLRMISKYADAEEGSAGTLMFSYDDKTKMSTYIETFKQTFDGDLSGSLNATMKECSTTDNKNDCIKVKATMKFDDGNYEDEYSLVGKADSNGGYMESFYEMGGQQMKTRDYFDGNGNAIALENWDGGAWATNSGTVPDSSIYNSDFVMTSTYVPSFSGVSWDNGTEYYVTLSSFKPASPELVEVLAKFSTLTPQGGSTTPGEIIYWGSGTETGTKLYKVTAYNDTNGEPDSFSEVSGATISLVHPTAPVDDNN